MPADHHAILRDMHRVAGEYHRHFSISRTTVSSLFVPIGILTSISMLTTCKSQHQIPTKAAFAIIFFILLAALVLNAVFARWSRISRRLERFYESLEGSENIQFDAGAHGFRHLFRSVNRGEVVINGRRMSALSGWTDIFVWLILVLGTAYLIGYTFVFDTICRGAQPEDLVGWFCARIQGLF